MHEYRCAFRIDSYESAQLSQLHHRRVRLRLVDPSTYGVEVLPSAGSGNTCSISDDKFNANLMMDFAGLNAYSRLEPTDLFC